MGNDYPGVLTVLEGMDASGKGTQAQLLGEYISTFKPCVLHHFPAYNMTAGKIILDFLKGDAVVVSKEKFLKASPKPTSSTSTMAYFSREDLLAASVHPDNETVLQALFAADRYHTDTNTREHLEKGGHVVFDRYYHSSIMYGQSMGVDVGFLKDINESVVQPDLAIFLDIPLEESIRRRPDRRDRFESNNSMLTEVRGFYRGYWIEQAVSGKYHILDGTKPVEELQEQIKSLWETAAMLKSGV